MPDLAPSWIDAYQAAWAAECAAMTPLPTANEEDIQLGLDLIRHDRRKLFWTFAIARLWQMVDHCADRDHVRLVEAGAHWRRVWPDITDLAIRQAKAQLPPPRVERDLDEGVSW